MTFKYNGDYKGIGDIHLLSIQSFIHLGWHGALPLARLAPGHQTSLSHAHRFQLGRQLPHLRNDLNTDRNVPRQLHTVQGNVTQGWRTRYIHY